MPIQRTGVIIRPDLSRVVLRPFHLAPDSRIERIMARVASLSENEVEELLQSIVRQFGDRHRGLVEFFEKRYEQNRDRSITDLPVSRSRKRLIGSYLSHEYALESAALFNPSMVWHPDQTGVPEGSRRFVMSLRATGEGHISSIVFRSGVINSRAEVVLDKVTSFANTPELVTNPSYEKALFYRKLTELGINGPLTESVMAALGDFFTLSDLQRTLATVLKSFRTRQREFEPVAHTMTVLARANYEAYFERSVPLGERILFPSSPTETNGIEDARFVLFSRPDGSKCYYATYTAYDGRVTLPQMLETEDFLTFKVGTLNGPEVRNKGFALFPRLVNGQYAMLSRQDNENLYIMYSDGPHFWYTKQLIARPSYSWEFVQLGNCGSPIETDAGWLVLTHAVGPMRRYVMSAFLLDLHDPTRVIGRLSSPLLEPNEVERNGYVPNVVYSCGAVVHAGQLIIPYAMSDYASSIATIPIDELIAELTCAKASM